MKSKNEQRKLRHRRIRAKISGTKECPRLSIFKSNNYIYAQLIDDNEGNTLLSLNDLSFDKKNEKRTEKAKKVGKELAEKAKKQKIKKIVFDRGGYKYHGRVKALAEGAREGGLEF
jgi:large subunit ribosomal protein L18